MANAPFTKSGDTIVQDFAAAAQSTSRTPLDFSIGSVFRAIGEGIAAVADWLQKLYLFALLISRLQTSRGPWVDSFCGDFMPAVAGSNSPRLPASPASGVVTFSRSTPQSQVLIPVGAQVTTYDGLKVFQVTADTTNVNYSATIIPGGAYIVPAGVGSIDAPVSALATGSGGNVLANTITLVRSSLVGVDTVTNAGPFQNGLDAESDDALKARFKLFILSLRAGTEDAIRYAIASLQQGLQIAYHDNMDPGGVTDNGAVTVFVDDGSGGPSSALVNEAINAVNAVRAAGTRAMVIGASRFFVNASMTVSVAAGYDAPTVKAAVANAVSAYIQSLQVEQPLRYTMLEHIAYNASAGVANVTSVRLNNVTADIIPPLGNTIRLDGTGVVVN